MMRSAADGLGDEFYWVWINQPAWMLSDLVPASGQWDSIFPLTFWSHYLLQSSCGWGIDISYMMLRNPAADCWLPYA